MLNSVFFCLALSIKLQIVRGSVLHTSKNKIHTEALYERPIGFGYKILLMQHMS